jgi:hypothetical protein
MALPAAGVCRCWPARRCAAQVQILENCCQKNENAKSFLSALRNLVAGEGLSAGGSGAVYCRGFASGGRLEVNASLRPALPTAGGLPLVVGSRFAPGFKSRELARNRKAEILSRR